MRELIQNEQQHVSAGYFLSDVQGAVTDGFSSSERALTVAVGAGSLMLGSYMGPFGATVLAGGAVAGYLFFDWADV